MNFKKTTLTLLCAIASLCHGYSQDFTIETSNLESGFNISMQITNALASDVTVEWGVGNSQTESVTGIAKIFTAPESLVGRPATIKISGKAEIIGIDNKIDKFTVNTTTTSLRELLLDQCNLSNIDIKKAAGLEILTITLNEIKSIDLSGNTSLKSIKLNGNSDLAEITLPVSGFSDLTFLNLNNTKVGGSTVQSIVNTATNLETLLVNKQDGVTDNKLTSINLTGNSKLKDIQLQYNNLSGTLNLGNKPELDKALLNNNKIEVLSVTSATLDYLNLNDNDISVLNVTAAPNIASLYCNNNKLAKLNLTGNTGIKNLLVNNNMLTSITFDPATTGLNSLEVKENLFDFATFPRISAITYLYTGQKTLLDIQVLSDDYYSVDMGKYMNPVPAGAIVPGTAGKESVITWWGYDNNNGKEAELKKSYSDFEINGNVYSFSKDNLEEYFTDNKVFAKITNAAFPNISGKTGSLFTIEIELGKQGVGLTPDKNNTINCYYNAASNEVVYNVENADRASVYNLAGQGVLDQNLATDNGSINISDLAKGVYIVVIKGAKTSVKQKFVKQ